jgi:hypothetical protein
MKEMLIGIVRHDSIEFKQSRDNYHDYHEITVLIIDDAGSHSLNRVLTLSICHSYSVVSGKPSICKH